VLSAGLAAQHASHAASADWNGYASIASDSMFRGVSLIDSGPAFQAGLEGRIDDTFVVGAWAANIDHQWLYETRLSDRTEVNLYGGIDFACGARCRARFIVSDYLFPGPAARDWQEATFSIGFAERIGATISYSPHGLGSGKSTRTVEGWLVQPLSRDTSIAVDAGNVWLGSTGYWYTRAGISRRFDRWVVDLSHYWSDPKYRRYGFDDRSQRFVLSVSTAF
jgi:uncharacterized protein (TIGR02001 family)